ncbi:hypothetical protein E8E15_009792 [Penicillium rubens]|jgi:hypothetical protein|uniref:Uncharacterized protein n=2 Tax=Penicillium chrysogenum species complex TaxID=254878 RepID=B6H5N8_PENRW|nr:uncharacterized protein N7525_000053 [Penicillium rubens]KZN89945.1 hypothetical protein EN45_000510 [Penicillium chrysogenum]CAP74196.1 hypothetical protein PCH_Pc14g00550 [Penicillium rubens Wisconsin 54-1255]KAF3024667.1 hypothetical protein E8E15_009792 [Penicillium rubens]KAJ5040167.1 hypothetical protein NUH16_009969 [Penicillium rubens]KAJ5842312.1 hypothetical protein N7525_000053 [Penicillium rubens]
MAPAIREVTQTLIVADTTFVSVITLGHTKPWPTLNLATLTATTPFTTVIHVVDRAATPPPKQIRSARSTGLSNGNKGAIAGSILGVGALLLLLYYLYLCHLQSRPLTPRSAKVPLDPEDPTPAPEPVSTDNAPSKNKKSVTISSDLPRYLPRYYGSKDIKSIITPIVRMSAEVDLKTRFETREGRLGQRVRYMIRKRKKPRVKKRRRRRRRRKRKATKDDAN